MKAKGLVLAMILLLMAGCGGNRQSTDEIIVVDVTKSYPKKELILQDFMDVEYIVLETSDEFLTQGVVKAVGKDIILVANQIYDGDIFVFDRTGKGIRKINRKGQGPEEYTNFNDIIIDENNNEFFVVAFSDRKILVYDFYGNFKRSFKNADDRIYSNVMNYDRDNLIGYKLTIENKPPSHVIISKLDGSTTREIHVPYKEIKSSFVTGENGAARFTYHQTIPYHRSFVLVEISSDTVYNYLPDNNQMNPFIVRTPSIHSMDPEVFLLPCVFTDHYYFMQTITKKYDFETWRGFPYNVLVYDKQENAVFEYTMYNDDFTNRRHVFISPPVNHEIVACQILQSYQLVEAYEKGQLKGRLKEIAAGLDVEDNPVIMLVKHKR